MRNGLLLILALGMLGACTRVTVFGHTVKDDSGAPAAVPAASAASAAEAASPAASPAPPSVQQRITRLALEVTPAAQQQTAADERFNTEDLREAVIAGLRAHGLLDLQNTGTGRVAVLQVEEFAIRATSNVVLFGRLPSAGVLSGTLRIREPAAGEAREFRVQADIPLSIARDGTDKHPLKNLYNGFARQLVDVLTGAPPAPPPRR